MLVMPTAFLVTTRWTKTSGTHSVVFLFLIKHYRVIIIFTIAIKDARINDLLNTFVNYKLDCTGLLINNNFLPNRATW